MKIEDQLHRTLYLKETPQRIISLVPSQTELLCDLGLKSALVGLTKFCVHPNHIKSEVPVVGGTKQVHIETIKALKPDIILCNKEENTKELVAICETICPVHISDIYNLQDSLELIEQYGIIFNRKEEALSITESIKIELADFDLFIKDKKPLKTAYFIWRNPWMVAANSTFINALLRLNKFENIFNDTIRYPEIALENLSQELEVELILLSSEPFPFAEKHINEVRVHIPKATIKLVDGELFSWYGSRLLKAFKYFKALRLSLQNTQL